MWCNYLIPREYSQLSKKLAHNRPVESSVGAYTEFSNPIWASSVLKYVDFCEICKTFVARPYVTTRPLGEI